MKSVLYCVYNRPEDFPEKCIARAWTYMGEPTDMTIMADTLDELRAMKPEGMRTISRHPEDVPAIVECWL